jgi:hexulose-6-phosphate isomerase
MTRREFAFAAVEIPLGDAIPMDAPADELKRIAEASRSARVAIASLWVSAPLSATPLNSPDPEKRAKGVEVMKRAVDIAAEVGCEALLVAPGRPGAGTKMQVGCQDTWDRVSAELRKVVPYAAAKKVCVTPENVWNKFLVSPLEMRAPNRDAS